MKENLIIFGAGSQAKIIFDIIQLRNEFKVIAFIDDNKKLETTKIMDIPVLSGIAQLETFYAQGVNNIIVGVGDNHQRKIITKNAIDKGFSLVSAIHPSAVVAEDVILGAGTVLKALAVIETGAKIGKNTTIGAHAYIGHEVNVGDLVHISGGVRIGGKSIINNEVNIGIGAVLKDNICIGKNSQVGAGSLVLEDIPENYVAFGVPARLLWERKIWDKK